MTIDVSPLIAEASMELLAVLHNDQKDFKLVVSEIIRDLTPGEVCNSEEAKHIFGF